MLSKIIAVSLTFGFSASALAAGGQAARQMAYAAQTAQQTVQSVKQETYPQRSSANREDTFIMDSLLPEIEYRFDEAQLHFMDASFVLDQNPSDFNGRRTFRRGCLATARASLFLGTAYTRSTGANVFSPYAQEFEDVRLDIETARRDNGC